MMPEEGRGYDAICVGKGSLNSSQTSAVYLEFICSCKWAMHSPKQVPPHTHTTTTTICQRQFAQGLCASQSLAKWQSCQSCNTVQLSHKSLWFGSGWTAFQPLCYMECFSREASLSSHFVSRNHNTIAIWTGMQQLSTILTHSTKPPFTLLTFYHLQPCQCALLQNDPPLWVPRPTLKLIEYSRHRSRPHWLQERQQKTQGGLLNLCSTVRAFPNSLRGGNIVRAHCGRLRKGTFLWAHRCIDFGHIDFPWGRRSPAFCPRTAAVSKHKQASSRPMSNMVTEPHTRCLSLTQFWKWCCFSSLT